MTLGKLYLNKMRGKDDQAYKILTKANRLDPELKEVYSFLLKVQVDFLNIKELVPTFKNYFQLFPEDVKGFNSII